jgi:hypothetical protein
MKYKIIIEITPTVSFRKKKTEKLTVSRYWKFNDNLHRLDGPAYESNFGHEEWYFDGYHIPSDENEK